MSEPVVLRKDIPQVNILSNDGEDFVIQSPPGSGWQIVQYGADLQLEWDGYIDMAGYAREDRTFITAGGSVLRGGFVTTSRTVTATGAVVPSFLMEWIFALQSPLEPAMMIAGGVHSVPSFLGSTEQPEQVILGEANLWSSIATNQTGGTTDAQQTNLIQSTQFGMGNATASDRIYVAYRQPLTAAVVGQTHFITIPPMAVVLGGVSEIEPDLVYIDRLRRAYELQQSPDVD